VKPENRETSAITRKNPDIAQPANTNSFFIISEFVC
jgi:hypothetical protein